MTHTMGIRAYARHRGVTPAAVRKAIKSGRITVVGGNIDPNLADSQWQANTDESKPRSSVARTPTAPPAHIVDLPARAQGSPETLTFAKARAARETFEARLKELDLKIKTGKLIPIDEVRVAAFNTNRRARDLLLAIPDRVAPVAAGLTDLSEVHKVLTEELRRVCEELSQPVTFGRTDETDLP